jgi:hypothetical protein
MPMEGGSTGCNGMPANALQVRADWSEVEWVCNKRARRLLLMYSRQSVSVVFLITNGIEFVCKPQCFGS